LYSNAEVGKYYNFEHEVSVEVRSREDPYMVFAYTRDNLGTDFKIFLYMSMITILVVIISIFTVGYYWIFKFERID